MSLEKRKRRDCTPEGPGASSASKRRRQLSPDDTVLVHAWPERDDLGEDDFWATAALYSLFDEVPSTGERPLGRRERGSRRHEAEE